jgi:hypothetical protein
VLECRLKGGTFSSSKLGEYVCEFCKLPEPLPAPEGHCFQELAWRMCCKQVVSVRKCDSAEALTFNRASLRLEAFSRNVAKLVVVCELKATARGDISSTSCFRTSSAAAFLAFLPLN